MVLSFSRHLFARICFDQKVERWLRLHAEAFEHFGGVPRLVVPDNLTSAVVRAAFSPSDETTLNRSYRDSLGTTIQGRPDASSEPTEEGQS